MAHLPPDTIRIISSYSEYPHILASVSKLFYQSISIVQRKIVSDVHKYQYDRTSVKYYGPKVKGFVTMHKFSRSEVRGDESPYWRKECYYHVNLRIYSKYSSYYTYGMGRHIYGEDCTEENRPSHTFSHISYNNQIVPNTECLTDLLSLDNPILRQRMMRMIRSGTIINSERERHIPPPNATDVWSIIRYYGYY